jgi:ABC-type uncharacterized transport system ATPase subunit
MYKGFRAVDHIHLDVKKGDIFGFLGPNFTGTVRGKEGHRFHPGPPFSL